jgi:hypothetical protein
MGDPPRRVVKRLIRSMATMSPVSTSHVII